MNTAACSNGPHGLASKFPTFGDLPDYPYVGGVFAVSSWNSANCGTCWAVTYPETGVTINVLAIDVASPGFNVAQAAMDKLTNGKATQLGKVEVNVEQVPTSACKL
uniref:Cerato-platanin 3 n=3 Tax=Heterobasidion annosum species complex TaxID=256003 RepID=A0A0A1IXC5_9AGAM|nr:cerato-platanin-like protein 1 [Heterobasidion annosum]CEH24659.1 cerato-platanin 3 [Heterobasidion irregulare]CEH24660.1 cerato-platanin 3 [Heterobasidion irregulare]CEH24661.1 cerato-platanin 3 [Heterobasidion irregulare]